VTEPRHALLRVRTHVETSAAPGKRNLIIGAGSRNRTGTVFPPADFESAASTYFATPAQNSERAIMPDPEADGLATKGGSIAENAG
jgi:hypothetical protein